MIFIIVLVLVVVDKLCSRRSTLVYIILYKYYITVRMPKEFLINRNAALNVIKRIWSKVFY